MTTAVAFVLAILPSLVCGIILIGIRRVETKLDKKEENRSQEWCLILKYVDSVGRLAEHNAKCLRGQKINGELEEAIQKRDKEFEALQDYLYTRTACGKK